VRQTPSHESVAFFEMHLPVRVWKDGRYKDLRLFHSQQNQEFLISEERVDSIQFDPEKWLCAKADIVLPAIEVTKSEQIKIITELSGSKIRIILPEFSGTEMLRVFDLNGQAVLSVLLNGLDSRIETGTLKKGLYLVEVLTKTRNKVEKIVVN